MFSSLRSFRTTDFDSLSTNYSYDLSFRLSCVVTAQTTGTNLLPTPLIGARQGLLRPHTSTRTRSFTNMMNTIEASIHTGDPGNGNGGLTDNHGDHSFQQQPPATFPSPSLPIATATTPVDNIRDDVPVFVMLPLDTVNADGVFKYAASRWFMLALQQLKESGVHGVAVDVWWAAVERRPRRYDWSGYRHLFDRVASLGLKIQVVMAFHACGGNVGDNAEIPLPSWVLAAGERDPDIFFTDRPRESTPGQRNRECISLFAAEEPGLLKGRSAIQCYVDFMRAFRDEFLGDLGTMVEDVVIGAGPCGELRYPSYPEPNGWRFPGIGEFQCYDRRALASLARAAAAVGRPEWGNAGPHDAGTYNCSPEETGFFQGWYGRWDSEYGRFFLGWYTQALIDHGERMLAAAASVFTIAPSTTTTTTANFHLFNHHNNHRQQRRLDGYDSIDTPRSLGGVLGDDNSSMEHGWPVWRQGSGVSLPGSNSDRDVKERTGNMSVNSLDGMGTMNGNGNGSAEGNGSGNGGGSTAGVGTGLGPPPPPSSSSVLSLSPSAVPPQQMYMAGPGVSRPASFASFRSSSVSEGLNALEDWTWPTPTGPAIGMTLKIAGVHWWYRTRSHAAEITAGYYNCEGRQGYDSIVALCARYGASLTLTCVEMCDSQHPPEALCGPEGLLRQVREAACAVGVPVGGENALPCFMPNVIDETALQRVVYNTQPWGTPLQQGGNENTLVPPSYSSPPPPPLLPQQQQQRRDGDGADGADNDDDVAVSRQAMSPTATPSWAPQHSLPNPNNQNKNHSLPPMRNFTFLRLTPEMMSPSYFDKWERFVSLMSHNGQKFRSSPRWRQNLGFSSGL